MKYKIIGLVGAMGSGKGEVAKILQDYGYQHFSLSDVVREEAVKLGLVKTRENLQNVGNRLREEFGNDVLAKRTVDKIGSLDSQKIVIDSIRNPGEVLYLKNILEAFILGIKVNEEIRFNRIMAKAGEDYYPKDLNEAKTAFNRESGIEEKESGQQLTKSLRMSDLIIENNGTLEDLQISLKNLIS